MREEVNHRGTEARNIQKKKKKKKKNAAFTSPRRLARPLDPFEVEGEAPGQKIKCNTGEKSRNPNSRREAVASSFGR